MTERDDYRKLALADSVEVRERAQRSGDVRVLSMTSANNGYEIVLAAGAPLDFDGDYSIIRWDDELER